MVGQDGVGGSSKRDAPAPHLLHHLDHRASLPPLPMPQAGAPPSRTHALTIVTTARPAPPTPPAVLCRAVPAPTASPATPAASSTPRLSARARRVAHLAAGAAWPTRPAGTCTPTPAALSRLAASGTPTPGPTAPSMAGARCVGALGCSALDAVLGLHALRPGGVWDSTCPPPLSTLPTLSCSGGHRPLLPTRGLPCGLRRGAGH